MPPAICDRVAANGHLIETRRVLRQGLHDADLVYATRIQRERMSGEMREGYTPDFRVDRAFVDTHCGVSTVLMHPLPRDSSPGANDLSTDLDGDPRLAIFRQTDNGVAVRMAIFATLLGVESLLQRGLRDAPWRHPHRIGPMDADFHALSPG